MAQFYMKKNADLIVYEVRSAIGTKMRSLQERKLTTLIFGFGTSVPRGFVDHLLTASFCEARTHKSFVRRISYFVWALLSIAEFSLDCFCCR